MTPAGDAWAEFFARQNRPQPPRKKIAKTLVSAFDRRYIEERRAQIATARENGVTLEERDGRTFNVVHLPAVADRL